MKLVVAILVLFFAVLWFGLFDFSYLKGAITLFPSICEENKCINLSKLTFTPSSNAQSIILKRSNESSERIYSKCKVFNRTYWFCSIGDNCYFEYKYGQFKSSTPEGIDRFRNCNFLPSYTDNVFSKLIWIHRECIKNPLIYLYCSIIKGYEN